MFSPKPPGRAAGIRAIADLPGGAKQTTDFEIALVDATGSAGPKTASQALRAGNGATDVKTANVHVLKLPPAVRPRFESSSSRVSMPVRESTGIGTSRQALCGASVGDTPEKIDTNGSICFVAYQVAVGIVTSKRARNKIIFFTKEGKYYQVYASEDVYFPPDLANVGTTISTGCVRTPAQVESSYFVEFLNTRSISASIPAFNLISTGAAALSYPTGLTFFQDKDGHFVPGIQYDSTVGLGVGLLGIEFPVSVSIQVGSGNEVGPKLSGATPCGSMDMGTADPDDLAAAAVNDALDPLKNQLQLPEGQPAEPAGLNVIAGSNANAFQNLGTNEHQEGCAGCPASNLDDLANEMEDAFSSSSTGEDVASKAPPIIQQLPDALPSPQTLDVVLQQALPGITLADDLYEQRASNGKNIFVAKGLITIDAAIGKPVTITITPDEVASLLGHPVADVIGATLTIDGSPQVDAATFALDAGGVTVNFTPGSSAPVVVHTTVDLSTAKGVFGDVSNWYVALTPRLIRPEAGDATQADISGPSMVASGGSVALNVLVRDANGNPVDKPVTVHFQDGQGMPIGAAQTEHGVATVQYVPSASTPVLTSATITTLTKSDGTDLPGFELDGTGFSVDADIYVDGALLDPKVVARDFHSAAVLLVATTVSAGVKVYLVNPGGQRSNELTIVAQQ